MKKVIILGAGGSLAKEVIEKLKTEEDIRLTLFLRNKNRLRNKDVSGYTVIEGNVLDFN